MKNKKGFTLVELLVVMVIFGIIIGLSYPAIKVLQSKSLDKKFNTYKDSVSTGAKLYKDSYDEDMFGRNENGCTCISFDELNSKKLVKDISINDVTCDTENTFVRVTKVEDNYSYTSYLGCKDKSSSDIDYIYPKAQEIHSFDSEGCNTLCNPEKSNGLYVYADPEKDTHYTKSKTIRLHVQSITGINQGIDISSAWSTSNTGSDGLTNYKKVRISAPDDQKKKITAGQIIEVDPPKIKTPAKSSGSYYLHVRVDNLTDLYGASWSQGDGGKYLIFGPYNIDNEPPLITKANIIPTDSNHNLPKPNLTVKAIDNITETENLRNCVSITKDSKFHHQLYTGTNKNILINSNNGCLEKYVNNSTYISNYYKKISNSVNLSIMDKYGISYPTYVSVIDEAGNHSYRELNYQAANKYTIEYDSNEGSLCNPVKKEVITKVSGDTLWGTLCEPTRTGYTFKGWFEGTTEITKNTKATRNLKVRAKWVKNNKITYVINSPKMLTWNYIFGNKYMHDAATKEGYTIFSNPSIYNQNIERQLDAKDSSLNKGITYKGKVTASTSGISFPGTNGSYIELGNLDSLKKVTAEVTFKHDGGTGGVLVGNGQGGGFSISIDPSNNLIMFSIGVRHGNWIVEKKKWDVEPYERIKYKHNFSKDQKYHIVGTFDGSVMALYVNGIEVSKRDLIAQGQIPSAVDLHPPIDGATGKIGAEPSTNGTAHEPYYKGKIYSMRVYSEALDATDIVGNFRRENIRYNIVGDPTNEKFYVKLTTQEGRKYTVSYKYKNYRDIDLVKGGKGIRVVATTEKPTGSEIPSSSIIGSNYLSKDVLSSFETPTFDFIATGSTTYLTVDFSDASANDIDFKTILGQFKVSSLYEQGKPLGTKLLLSRRTGIFAGWNTKATGAGNFIDNSTIVNSDLTLYGRWTSHKCTVNYNPNGGTFTKHASDIKQVFDSGDSGISNMRDAAGGYYAAQKAHSVPYPGEEWKNGNIKYNESQGYTVAELCPHIASQDEEVTLYVNWGKNYKLTLDHGGATGNIPEDYYYTLNEQLHDTARLDNPVSNIGAPTKSIINDLYDVHYKFRGYYTQTEGKGLQIINENGAVNSTNVNKITGDITIYAYWTKIGWEFVNKGSLADYRHHLTEQLWKYWKDDGNYATGWQKICYANYDCGDDKGWYYFYPGNEGYMAIGWFKVNGKWYYADPTDSGGEAGNGYVDASLCMNTIRWFNSGTSNAYCAHFDGNGECFSGTVKYNNKEFTCEAYDCPRRP